MRADFLAHTPVVLATLAALVAGPATAGCCRDNNTAAINNHTTRTGNHIVDTINEVGWRMQGGEHGTLAGIILTIQEQAQNQRNEANRIIAAVEKTGDAGSTNAMLRQRQAARARAESGRYDPALSACASLGAARMREASLRATADGGSHHPSHAAGDGRDAVDAGRRAELCQGEGGGFDPSSPACRGVVEVAEAMIADRDASAGLGGVGDPTSDIRVVLGHPTIDTTRDPEGTQRALARLTRNIVNPLPERPLTAAQLSKQDTEELGRRHARRARRSAPAATLGWLQDVSVPAIESAGIEPPPGYNRDIPPALSRRQWLELEVSRRWANPDWQVQLNALSPEAVQREQTLVLALLATLVHWSLELDMHRAATEAAHAAHSMEPL